MEFIASIGSQALYMKGTTEVHIFDPATNERRAYSNKVKNNQIEASCNLGEVTGGIGDALLITIPDTSRLKLTLTKADISLSETSMALGADLHYGGVVDLNEAVEAGADGKLKVSQTPVAPLGGCDICCTVGVDGKSYLIDPETKEVQDFVGVAGQTYCVRYWVLNPSAQQMDVFSSFEPMIMRVFMKQPVYAAPKQGDPMKGTRVGYMLTTVPRMQFDPNTSFGGDQTTAETQNISGNALSFDEACEAGVADTCLDAGKPKLMYRVLVLDGDSLGDVTGLAVVGGGVDVVVNGKANLPVKYVVKDISLVQADMSALTFTVAEKSIASVDANGVVTGLAEGSTEVKIELTGKGISTTANIDVAAQA